jgi:hypothetical protein
MSDVGRAFKDLWDALSTKEQRNSLKVANRKAAKKTLQIAKEELNGAKFGKGTRQPLSNGLRSRVYSRGGGFMITTKPYKTKGFHINRQGLEKPILMWLTDGADGKSAGTKGRYTKSRTKVFARKRKGHYTGVIKSDPYLTRAESRATPIVEESIYNDLRENVEKRLRQKGLL